MNRRYRKTIIAGNWKMNMTASDTKKFAEDIKAIMPRAKWCDVVVCVPFVNIPTALKAFKDLRISVGAQNQNGKQGIEMPQGFLLHGDVLLFLFLFSLRGQSAFRRAYSPPKRTGRSEISLVKKGHRPFLTSSCKMPGSTGHSAWGFAWGSVVNPGAG